MISFRTKLREYYWQAKFKQIPAYIHIPKTGGTYLAQLESDANPVLHPVKYFGHSYVTSNDAGINVIYAIQDLQRARKAIIPKNILGNYFVFSTVRNIFDWLVSYAWHAGGWNPKYVDKDHYDYNNASKGFDYLLKTIVNREDQWPCRKFIHCQLFANDGDMVVDWINRTDTLDADLEALAHYKSITYTPKEKHRVGKTDDYRKYYSTELIDLVYQTWGREIKLFSFEFEGSGKPAFLKQKITEREKDRIKYFWAKNTLEINGRVITMQNINSMQDLL